MRLNDLTGKKFGKLSVIERSTSTTKHARWLCKCECGNTKSIQGNHLIEGSTTSCGNCHNAKSSRLYKSVWNKIFQRCYNPNNKDYPYYGGRGIKVCDEWHDYLVFKEWAVSHGYCETAPYGKCTLDRVDVNGDYCPSNCRFITITEQNRNKTNNHFVTFNGETHTVSEWAEITKINANTLYRRIKAGWETQRVFSQPTQKRGDE